MFFFLSAVSDSPGASTLEQRRRYLEQLRRVLTPSPAWEAWVRNSEELPPDFSELPVWPDLQDPLVRPVEGRPIRLSSPAQWKSRREELLAEFHQWVLGTVPPAPDNLQAEVLREREDYGATLREVMLTFGPDHKAKLLVELLIPHGSGPFPVFMTQDNHRSWALLALRRGYLACVYAGADSRDDTDTFVTPYPECDWSKLTRRAWAAGRCVDYLAKVPQADGRRIVLAGHSRNGKVSLIAAALDERISAVISSSSGAGGALAARHFSEQHSGEGIELLTRSFPDWFHPRLRFFVGRENRLPVDFHELPALAAPRPCLLSIALNDAVEGSWAMQQTYLSAQRVYKFLDAGDRLGLLWRGGGHETSATIIGRYLDWCDTQFGRQAYPFAERLIHAWDWDAWQRESGERMNVVRMPRRSVADTGLAKDGSPILTPEDWQKRRGEIREHVGWMLGDAPPGANAVPGNSGTEPAHVSTLLARSAPGDGLEKEQVVFGEYVDGDLYFPAGLRQSGQKAPAILWLHPFSCSHGYGAGYKRGGQPYRNLARAGFVVLCMDQIGFGARIEEAEGFYERARRGSLLGKMLRDSQSALDVLAGLPYVDGGKIWGLGYSLGSLVGLHLGALDDRLAGFVSVCGPPPFRTDRATKGTGGIRRWSHLHMLMPRLGYFLAEEERIPYDLPDLLASFAPRPVLVVSPRLDWEAPLEDVSRGVEAARVIYRLHGAEKVLEQYSPEAYNHFDERIQAPVIEWLRKQP